MNSKPQIIALLKEWDGLFKSGLPGVSTRQVTRWFNNGKLPTPNTAREIARAVWNAAQRPGLHPMKKCLFDVLEKHFPGSVEDTNSEEQFVCLIGRLASDAKEPLDVVLDVMISKRYEKGFRSLVTNEDVLPVRCGDQIYISVVTNKPAWFILVWINQEGRPIPMNKWTGRGSDLPNYFAVGPQDRLIVPQLNRKGESSLTVSGEEGLETIAVFTNMEKPTGEAVAALNQKMRTEMPSLNFSTLRHAVRSKFSRENGVREVSQSVRGPLLLNHEDPVGVLHKSLAAKVIWDFDHSQFLSFPNGGNNQPSNKQ